MTIQRVIVGHINDDETQQTNLASIITELGIDPIDQLIGTPENPVPEDVDFYSLIDILKGIIDNAQ
jgi:hypothetical protein